MKLAASHKGVLFGRPFVNFSHMNSWNISHRSAKVESFHTWVIFCMISMCTLTYIHNFHGVWFNDYDWLCVISIRYVLIIVACYVSVRQAHSNLLPHTTAANDSRARESVAEVSANWDQLTLKHHPLEANAQTGFHDFPLFISATNTRASMYEYRT